MLISSRSVSFALLCCLLVLLVLPTIADKFSVQMVTKMMIMAILAMSLDLLVGYTGLISLGHAAFFGVAGYILAFTVPPYQAANLWISLLLTVSLCALLAAIIGLLTLRTSGIFFIMVTLAIAQMLYFLVHDSKLVGGSDGVYIYLRPDATFFGWKPFDMENFVHFYYLVVSLLTMTFILLRRIVNSLFGCVLSGIRTNEVRMRSLGYPTFRYKLVCFIISGSLAGMAGYLSAAQFGFVNPDMLGWHLSGNALMMVVLGGMGTLVGPAMGAFIMPLLELTFQSIPDIGGVNLGKHWQLCMGATIVLVALLLPGGLVGHKFQFSRKTLPVDE